MDRKNFLNKAAKAVLFTAGIPSLTFCPTNGQQNKIRGNHAITKDFDPDLYIELKYYIEKTTNYSIDEAK